LDVFSEQWSQVTNDERRQLHRQLWNVANELRGKMDADDFRDYILGFVFLKYLSERVEPRMFASRYS